MTKTTGIYKYELLIEAKGPSGLTSGSGYLYFTDRTGDTYGISIWDSSKKVHSLKYNSDKPEITTITWSNTSR